MKIEVDADAREAESQKGMNDSQLTGSTSSYARKYALNGLFMIDDTKDSDVTNTHDKVEKKDNFRPTSNLTTVQMGDAKIMKDKLDWLRKGLKVKGLDDSWLVEQMNENNKNKIDKLENLLERDGKKALNKVESYGELDDIPQ